MKLKYRLPSLIFRSLLSVLLLAALGGCKIFHPYRLPTPKPSPEFKAQQKEAEARKKASNLTDSPFNKKKKAAPAEEEAATDVSTPSGGAIAAPPAATPEARKLPERSTVRYDKHGMMKKPKLMRRRRHNKHGQPFRPIESIRNFFKFGLHAKPNYSPDHKPAPKQPSNADLPDEAMPEPKAEPAPAGDKP